MIASMRISYSSILSLILAISSFSSAHTVITYPGWRGNNLLSNGTTLESNGLAIGPNNTHPYGMQWEYPCGGMPTTTNRTKWPVTGGAVGFEPGWFPGHAQAILFINLGEGTVPINMSLNMLPSTGIIGPGNEAYNKSSVCFPQVPTPANFTAKVGDNATIQVVMLAQHGAALYSCVDITFADPKDVAEVNRSNCFNTSDITFTTVYTSTSQTGGAVLSFSVPAILSWIPLVAALAWGFL